jgi:hypothetical protein
MPVLDCDSAVSVQSKENFNDYLAMFCLYTLPPAMPAQDKIQMLTTSCQSVCKNPFKTFFKILRTSILLAVHR